MEIPVAVARLAIEIEMRVPLLQRRNVLEFLCHRAFIAVDQLTESRQVNFLQGARELRGHDEIIEASTFLRVAVLAGVVLGVAELFAELHRSVDAFEMLERFHVHVAVEHFVEDGADVVGAFEAAGGVYDCTPGFCGTRFTIEFGCFRGRADPDSRIFSVVIL
jgi:hypothetical protein